MNTRRPLRVLCLSEHVPPRVSGTARYAHEICTELAQLGHRVRLAAPGSERGAPPDIHLTAYQLVRLNTPFPDTGDPKRTARYEFCREAADYALNAVENGEVDIVHILFGMFLTESLDAAAIQHAGTQTFVTVHNVPPMECGRTWSTQSRLARIGDKARLLAVGAKNTARLKRHKHTGYVTASDQVTTALTRILPRANIKVIGHGASGALLERMSPPALRRPAMGEPVRLLTVGGWAPHKRQHLIPAIAAQLRTACIDFRWDIAGPNTRAANYFEHITEELDRLGLSNIVRAQGPIDTSALAALYDAAHLYVQPSTEEGFCITALDAAAAGLPVIGSPAGALPDLCAASGGALVRSDAAALAETIETFVVHNKWPADARARADEARTLFSWRQAAQELESFYRGERADTHAPLEFSEL